MSVVTLLDDVAVTGAGSAYTASQFAPAGASHFGVLKNFTVTAVYAGASPTSITLNIQGSLDNTSWFDLAVSSDNTDHMFHIADKPVVYVRGNITSLTAGSMTGATIKLIGGA